MFFENQPLKTTFNRCHFTIFNNGIISQKSDQVWKLFQKTLETDENIIDLFSYEMQLYYCIDLNKGQRKYTHEQWFEY